jgi:hypothetical protein
MPQSFVVQRCAVENDCFDGCTQWKAVSKYIQHAVIWDMEIIGDHESVDSRGFS